DFADNRTDYSIVQTMDGGKTWATKPLAVSPTGQIALYPSDISLQFLDAQTGWLRVRQQSSSNFDTGTLFKTTDGGATWTELNLPLDDYFKSPIGDPVYFVTDQLGWMVSRQGGPGSYLYRTQDGGQTWQAQTVGGLTQGTFERNFEIPQFVNA